MESMREAVQRARDAAARQQPAPTQSLESTKYKTKILEQETDYQCIGTGGWLAWHCPV